MKAQPKPDYELTLEQRSQVVAEWRRKRAARSPEEIEYDRERVERERLAVVRGRRG